MFVFSFFFSDGYISFSIIKTTGRNAMLINQENAYILITNLMH